MFRISCRVHSNALTIGFVFSMFLNNGKKNVKIEEKT